MGISANDHARTHLHPLGKPPDVTVGERHAAVGPVDCLLDVGVAATESMDSNLAAERRILRWGAMMSQGLQDGIELRLAEHAGVIRMAGDAGGRIIEAVEGIEAAVAIDPGDVEYAARRGFVSWRWVSATPPLPIAILWKRARTWFSAENTVRVNAWVSTSTHSVPPAAQEIVDIPRMTAANNAFKQNRNSGPP